MDIKRSGRIEQKEIGYIDFNTDSTYLMQEGRLTWDSNNGTLMLGMPGGNVNLQIGQEMYVKGKNAQGADIANGSACYVSGASGSKPEIKLANATNFDIATKTIGVATENIIKNQQGYITTFGIVRDIDTSLFNEGDRLYLADSSGGITNTYTTSNNTVIIGYCVTKSSVSGEIIVHPDNRIAKFGNVSSSNYGEFEEDGTLQFHGESRVWQDIDFPIIVRNTGPNIPSIATMQGNLTAPQWAVNSFAVCEGQEIIHQYAQGSTGRWHLHFYTGGTNVDARYLKWRLEYNWTNLSGTWDTTNITVESTEYEIPANTPALTHFLHSIALFETTSARIGGHIKARLTRIASVGTAPTANPFCEMLQMHVLCDTLGSREIASK